MGIISKVRNLRNERDERWVARRVEQCLNDDIAFNRAVSELTVAPGEHVSRKRQKLAPKIYDMLFEKARNGNLLRR